MKTLFIDIETVGIKPKAKVFVEPTEKDVKLGNLKDVEKIKEKIKNELPVIIAAARCKHEEDFIEEWKSNALSIDKSVIVALCYSIDDGDVVKISGSEREIMTELEKVVFNLESFIWVGHNISDFDIPIIATRAMKYGMYKLLSRIPNKPYGDRSYYYDTMNNFGFSKYKYRISLDDALRFFGLEGKGDIDGSMVHDMYINGEIENIVNYCASDVIKLRELYICMTGINLKSKLPF